RSLIGLGTGVAEEHLRLGGDGGVVKREASHELGRNLDDRAGGEQVGDVTQLGELRGHRLDDRGVRVAEGVDCDPGEQVDVDIAVDVGNGGALAGDQFNRWGAVGVEQYLGPAGERVLHGGEVLHLYVSVLVVLSKYGALRVVLPVEVVCQHHTPVPTHGEQP